MEAPILPKLACEAVDSGVDIINQDGHVDTALLTIFEEERKVRNATNIKPGADASR